MRASDLLGTEVLDRDGRPVGRVRDARLTPRGAGDWAVTGLIVGPGMLADRMGYSYGDVTGPWILATLLRRIGRRARWVPWGDVIDVTASPIVLRSAVGDLGSAQEQRR